MTEKRQGVKLKTGAFRVSYPQVFEPKAMKPGDKPKFSLCMLIPKDDTETLPRIREAINSEIKAEWPGVVPLPNGIGYTENKKVNGKMVAVQTKFKNPLLRDGDEERPDKDGYPGCFFVNTRTERKPGLIDKTGAPLMGPEEFYPGCMARASVTIKSYQRDDGGKGVACYLGNIMKVDEGEQLGGGGTSAEEDFAEDISSDIMG